MATKRDNPVPLIIGVLVTLAVFFVLLFLGGTVITVGASLRRF